MTIPAKSHTDHAFETQSQAECAQRNSVSSRLCPALENQEYIVKYNNLREATTRDSRKKDMESYYGKQIYGFYAAGWPHWRFHQAYAGRRLRFASALLWLFGKIPRSHHKGATGRARSCSWGTAAWAKPTFNLQVLWKAFEEICSFALLPAWMSSQLSLTTTIMTTWAFGPKFGIKSLKRTLPVQDNYPTIQSILTESFSVSKTWRG